MTHDQILLTRFYCLDLPAGMIEVRDAKTSAPVAVVTSGAVDVGMASLLVSSPALYMHLSSMRDIMQLLSDNWGSVIHPEMLAAMKTSIEAAEAQLTLTQSFANVGAVKNIIAKMKGE